MSKSYGMSSSTSYLQKFSKFLALAVVGLSLTVLAGMTLRASAAAPTTRFNFTQAELNAHWGAERIAPSGGYVSKQAFDRSNVVEIGVNSAEANDDVYHRTEGIKTAYAAPDNFSAPGNFGQSVSVDLYLNSDWSNKAVRAGLWTVGDNGNRGTDAINYPFGILEFAHINGYQGFRYGGTDDWVNVAGFKDYGKWVTLKIALDKDTHQYVLSIDGTKVGQTDSPAPSKYLYSVILNQRNFGKDPQGQLSTTSYAVDWQGGVAGSNEACKKDDWRASSATYKNQGQCVRDAARSSDSE